MRKDPIGWAVGIFVAIISFVVLDLMIGGTIDDALVGLVGKLFGDPVATLFSILLLVLGLVGLYAFVTGLSDRHHGL